MSAAETAWDGDWDSNRIDHSVTRAQVDPDGELRPVAVDESLTTLLFTGRARATPTPTPFTRSMGTPAQAAPARAASACDDDVTPALQGALFEFVH